jgi:hypothetical protein
MKRPENDNLGNSASEFLSGDLTEAHLNDVEMDAIVGGFNLKANGNGPVARSETTLGCWEDCTVSISGCKKLTT